MKPFEKLEISELIDLLAKYSLEYSALKKEMASDRKVKKYRSIIESLAGEIEKRRRTSIGPYNNISDRDNEQMKTA